MKSTKKTPNKTKLNEKKERKTNGVKCYIWLINDHETSRLFTIVQV